MSLDLENDGISLKPHTLPTTFFERAFGWVRWQTPTPGFRRLKPNARSKKVVGSVWGLSEMPSFSKSKLMACLQCPKRFWLEVHCPELREDSAASQAAFAAGRSVGEVARKLYDPKGLGIFIDVGQDGT